ncbi:cephalosporin hydroxylase [Paenibacillus alvei]|uniref:Cephalosporin hydroxylase n=2 Tax=Paenibacillus alvei TaxID=44250 RepID=A0AAP7DH98_PAEAL|nr:CmcI family methyltransferase [Paenibacillus alvei]MBG9736853.1 cephalosporin hydroxylase [Paenibacillus alvei]MBG9747009.1 cephalosporin hydroxylase [Paenibacillus alvei]MCY9582013.1 cephalosporin hydroxylase family protein [Paenibacillus alvei]MCY9585911.1 cephalosporin hydroxylase family protein [Paenibacillus alvei]NEZ43518.1 cephalosporin hydroxylase [Paenibacillus alvei]
MKSFCNRFVSSGVWAETYWLGHRILKCPFDLFIYQEILFELKPDVIVECGTNAGGSTLYLAHLCDLIGKGKIVSIDIEEMDRPKHDRITYLLGDTTSSEIVDQVKDFVSGHDTVLVILDSDHTEPHVLKEMDLYHRFVTVGSYMIVEDSIIGEIVFPQLAPGPLGAIRKFLPENDQFIVDESREKYHFTFNPEGYLLKIAEQSSKKIESEKDS